MRTKLSLNTDILFLPENDQAELNKKTDKIAYIPLSIYLHDQRTYSFKVFLILNRFLLRHVKKVVN
jgi:hypothetical protein